MMTRGAHHEIARIPKGKAVTYAQFIVDFCPQKEDPNRVRIMAGRNLIKYPHGLTTRTADLTTTKIMWNSTVSKDGTRYVASDSKKSTSQTINLMKIKRCSNLSNSA